MQKPKIKISVTTTTTTTTQQCSWQKRKTSQKLRESFLAFFFVCLFFVLLCVFYLLKNIKTFCKSLFTFNFNWKPWKKTNSKMKNFKFMPTNATENKKWSCLNESFLMQSNAINILKKRGKKGKNILNIQQIKAELKFVLNL